MQNNHFEKNLTDTESNNSITSKGENIYYFGTLLFVTGIILLSIGAAMISIFKIHYESEARLILYTSSFIGIGIISILIGINLMIKQKKKGYLAVSIGTIFSLSGFGMFILNYTNNWFYPTISYILFLYLSGFLILTGNAFGNVTLWLIENKNPTTSSYEPETQKSPKKTYTDEEIQRDIKEAIKKRLSAAADDLKFEIADTKKLKVSKFHRPTEKVVKVKDNIDESTKLKNTINPGSKEEWGSIGVDKASMQLSQTLTESTKNNKKDKNSILEKMSKIFHK